MRTTKAGTMCPTSGDWRSGPTVLVLAGLALTAGAGCGDDPNSLQGSMAEEFSLAFERVEIQKQDFDLLISYEKNASGGAVNIICKLVFNTEDLGLTKGKRVSGETFVDRMKIYRRAYADGDFPALKSGSISFEAFAFEQGGRVDGKFEAIFGDGRSLSGTFDGRVQELSLD